MCISIFETDPGDKSFPTLRGQHHASIADVKYAAQQVCYMCSKPFLDYESEEDPDHIDPNIATDTTSLFLEPRLHVISCPSGRLSVLIPNQMMIDLPVWATRLCTQKTLTSPWALMISL
jgi:hypothetical protein